MLLLFAGPAAGQTTWFVDASATPPGLGTPDAPYAAIQDALASPATLDGDTILVAPGVYEELVDFLGKEVVLESTGGAARTTIDASVQFSLDQSAVAFRNGEGPGAVLSGFTIRGGQGSEVSEPVFGVLFFAGGGILTLGSAPTIRDCVLVDNHAQVGGGLYGDDSRATLERCVFEDNTTTLFGAGLHLHASDVRLVDVELRGNTAQAQNGGGISLFGGRLEATGCVLDANEAYSGGSGGNLAADRGAEVWLRDVLVRRGFTLDGNGGGIWADASALRLQGCTIEDNVSGDFASNREGGGLYASASTVTVQDCAFLANRSGRGGGVCLADGVGVIRDTRFEGNESESGLNFALTQGGALAAQRSTVSVVRTHFADNQAQYRGPFVSVATAQGGAVWCDTPTVELLDCSFERNHAYYDGPADPSLSKPEPGAQGGAVFGPARILRCAFLANRATSRPGALIGRCEGGAVHGAAGVQLSSFRANEVRGVGPVPDRGPAAEAATLACFRLEGNLPASLPPLGPTCVTLACDAADPTARRPLAQR